jgi:hypothetical protein
MADVRKILVDVDILESLICGYDYTPNDLAKPILEEAMDDLERQIELARKAR